MKCRLARAIYFTRVGRVIWKADPKLLEIPDNKEQTDKLLKWLEESSSLVINDININEAEFLQKLKPTNYQFESVEIYIGRTSEY